MFKRIQNIESSFQTIRLFTLSVSLGSISLGAYAVFQSRKIVSDAQHKVLVLAPGQVYESFPVSPSQQLEIEARDHIRNFHQYFFCLDPDEKLLENNLKRALYLADNSAKQAYDLLREKGYYAGLVAGNISQRLLIDSLQLQLKHEPFTFRCVATQHIIRSSGVNRRRLVTQGKLRRVARSEHNSHGLLIESWQTLEHTDLKP